MNIAALLRRYLPAIISWLAVVVVALSLPVFVRTLFVVAASCWSPGASVLWLLESRDRLERSILVVALSVAASTIVTVLLSMIHSMTGLRSLALLAVIATSGTVGHSLREQLELGGAGSVDRPDAETPQVDER